MTVRVFYTKDERRLIEAADTVLNDPNSTLTDLERADRNKRRQIRQAEARAEGRKPATEELETDKPLLTKARHDEIHAYFMSWQTAYEAGKPLPDRIDATLEELKAYWQDAVELEEAQKAGPDAVANWERKIAAQEDAGTLYAAEVR